MSEDLQLSPHYKPYVRFPNVLKILYFKKNALEHDLSCIKGDIFFPGNMMLFFRRKMKDDLS